jgi:transcriptional regulator of acetoin/glycerol metabolism
VRPFPDLHYPTREAAPQTLVGPVRNASQKRVSSQTTGDKLAAARILGIGKTTLYRKLKQYHMEPAEQ